MTSEIIEVIVKAGAHERSISAYDDGTFTIKTTFPPEKGKANRDVIAQVADYFGLPKTSVEIISGQSYFRKRLRLTK